MDIFSPICALKRTDTEPKQSDYRMHMHDDYEIFCFLSGDAKYAVEGMLYPLCRGDILLMRRSESHHLVLLSDATYQRITVNFLLSETKNNDFFNKIMTPFNERPLGKFNRYPIKTHVVMKDDVLTDILDKYVKDYVNPDDYVFMSEKIVAITQGRAFPVDEIKPGWWAKTLSKFVLKTPYGIGLGMPCTMQLAIDEIGLPKILFASVCSAVTKLFGVRGVFYRILGEKARAIDGPCDCTIPPYNHYAKLAPERTNDVAKEHTEHMGVKVVVIDANDL